MIVEVAAMVLTDDGGTVAEARRRDLVVQIEGDWEGNSLKTEAGLIEAFDAARESMLRQIEQIRKNDPSKQGNRAERRARR